ncbi:MAG TPA: hypothetical protein VM677_34065 [Actinokineospora sp.]|jgi:hypothetical protein|nr:hypothetical protein [Actinokineospora sp.]
MSVTFGPDEPKMFGLAGLETCLASRIAGVVTAPHLPGANAPKLVTEEHRWPLPAEPTAEGRFVGGDWADDSAIGWWAEAAHPTQDAVRVIDGAADARGAAALWVTSRRAMVVFPRKLLADSPEAKAGGFRLFSSRTEWEIGDEVHDHLTIDANRIAGYRAVMVGRMIPSATFVVIGFADGSELYVRHDDPEKAVKALRELHGK